MWLKICDDFISSQEWCGGNGSYAVVIFCLYRTNALKWGVLRDIMKKQFFVGVIYLILIYLKLVPAPFYMAPETIWKKWSTTKTAWESRNAPPNATSIQVQIWGRFCGVLYGTLWTKSSINCVNQDVKHIVQMIGIGEEKLPLEGVVYDDQLRQFLWLWQWVRHKKSSSLHYMCMLWQVLQINADMFYWLAALLHCVQYTWRLKHQ